MGTNPSSGGIDRAIELTEMAMKISDETHYDKGEELLREAMELVPDEETFMKNYVEFCLQVAHNAMLAREYPVAIVYLHKVLNCTPDDAEALIDLGSAYAHNGASVEALESWHKALEFLDSKRGKDRENIAMVLQNVRQVQKGLREAGIE